MRRSWAVQVDCGTLDMPIHPLSPGGLMARDPKAEAALALHRFGCGPRIGAIAAIGSDPRGALLAELDRPGIGRIADPDLLSGGEAARAAFHFRQQKRAQRLAQRAEREMEQQAAGAPAQPGA